MRADGETRKGRPESLNPLALRIPKEPSARLLWPPGTGAAAGPCKPSAAQWPKAQAAWRYRAATALSPLISVARNMPPA